MENTRHHMRAIVERSPLLEHLLRQGRIGIVGGMYSVESGEVSFFEERCAEPVEVTATEPAAVA